MREICQGSMATGTILLLSATGLGVYLPQSSWTYDGDGKGCASVAELSAGGGGGGAVRCADGDGGYRNVQ